MKWWGIWPALFFLTASPVLALTIDFNNTPQSIDQNQDFTINVNISCSSCSDSYLRAVFFASGTNYFGFTKNNTGEWINYPGSQITSYLQVVKDEVKEGSWSGKLTAKPDPGNKAFSGPGPYYFKIGRYTSGGSVTWSSPVTIIITGPSPTPTIETEKPTTKPTPMPTTNPPTSTPAMKPTVLPTSILSLSATRIPLSPQVLSSTTASTIEVTANKSFPWIPLILISGGLIAITCAFLFNI